MPIREPAGIKNPKNRTRACRREITKLTGAIADLSAERDHFSQIFNNANDGIIIHDEKGCILEINEPYCRRLGYDRSEMLKLTLGELVPPELSRLIPQRMRLLAKERDRHLRIPGPAQGRDHHARRSECHPRQVPRPERDPERRPTPPSDYLLIDAVTLPGSKIPVRPIIKGDSLSLSIAAASIIAKVTRDRLMAKYHEMFPEYDFLSHKGYCTTGHLQRLARYGPCSIHRRTFMPVHELIIDAKRESARRMLSTLFEQ